MFDFCCQHIFVRRLFIPRTRFIELEYMSKYDNSVGIITVFLEITSSQTVNIITNTN